MNRNILAILALILASLSCGQYTSPLVPVSPTPAAPTDTATPLSPTQTFAVSTATPITPTAIVVRAFVNIHTEPDGSVSGYVKAGDPVEIVQCRDDWCQIKEPEGWIWQGCTSFNPKNLGCEAG